MTHRINSQERRLRARRIARQHDETLRLYQAVIQQGLVNRRVQATDHKSSNGFMRRVHTLIGNISNIFRKKAV